MGYYDFHSHILPGMDDGAVDVKMSEEMLIKLHRQNVDFVLFTPHFYMEYEDVDNFCERREKALSELMKVYEANHMPSYELAAEVALRRGVSKQNCKALSFGDNYILLELPELYSEWITDEIDNIMMQGLKPIIAHIERPYINYLNSKFEKVLDNRSFIYQINVAALGYRSIRNYFLKQLRYGARFVLGSDSHNTTDRRPDFDKRILVKRKLNKSFMNAVELNSKYILNKVVDDNGNGQTK